MLFTALLDNAYRHNPIWITKNPLLNLVRVHDSLVAGHGTGCPSRESGELTLG